MEPGESLSEACIREVLEETGLKVQVKGLVGVYTSPHILLEYPDGNRWQLVVLHFEAIAIGGGLSLSKETTELRYFLPSKIKSLEMSPLDWRRVINGFSYQGSTIICDDFVSGHEI
jgi:8-oxo-dGTP pyrophosphatase MutT (NUDIX family)